MLLSNLSRQICQQNCGTIRFQKEMKNGTLYLLCVCVVRLTLIIRLRSLSFCYGIV